MLDLGRHYSWCARWDSPQGYIRLDGRSTTVPVGSMFSSQKPPSDDVVNLVGEVLTNLVLRTVWRRSSSQVVERPTVGSIPWDEVEGLLSVVGDPERLDHRLVSVVGMTEHLMPDISLDNWGVILIRASGRGRRQVCVDELEHLLEWLDDSVEWVNEA